MMRRIFSLYSANYFRHDQQIVMKRNKGHGTGTLYMRLHLVLLNRGIHTEGSSDLGEIFTDVYFVSGRGTSCGMSVPSKMEASTADGSCSSIASHKSR